MHAVRHAVAPRGAPLRMEAGRPEQDGPRCNRVPPFMMVVEVGYAGFFEELSEPG